MSRLSLPDITKPWAVKAEWFATYWPMLKNVDLTRAALQEAQREARHLGPEDFVEIGRDGVGIIALHGPMMKRAGFWAMLFGFVGTEILTAAVNHAAANEDVSGILLDIDSPGGQIGGVNELATAVRRATQVKTVVAHIDDLGASAAFWVASQASHINATRTTEIGSIGTIIVVHDVSSMAEKEGIKVHAISTGKFKGMGVPGTPITDAHLEELQGRVDRVQIIFTEAVMQGRGMTTEQFNAVSDGRVFIAADAKRLGLIDSIGPMESAIQNIAGVPKQNRRNGARARMSEARLRLSAIVADAEKESVK